MVATAGKGMDGKQQIISYLEAREGERVGGEALKPRSQRVHVLSAERRARRKPKQNRTSSML